MLIRTEPNEVLTSVVVVQGGLWGGVLWGVRAASARPLSPDSIPNVPNPPPIPVPVCPLHPQPCPQSHPRFPTPNPPSQPPIPNPCPQFPTPNPQYLSRLLFLSLSLHTSRFLGRRREVGTPLGGGGGQNSLKSSLSPHTLPEPAKPPQVPHLISSGVSPLGVWLCCSWGTKGGPGFGGEPQNLRGGSERVGG